MKEKPILKLYKYEDSKFIQIAQIDDYQEVSFEHNLYSAGTFTITINYNIPNARLFERGMFIQFGSDPYDFGEILSIRDVIGQDGKGSQIRTITGYDARYIFKRRIIKNLNANGMWKMTAKGEVCIRELIKSECGLLAEEKRQLPVKNIPSYLNKFESEPLPVNECYWGGCYSKEKHLFILTGEQGTILRSRDAFNWEVALNLGGGWFERCFYSDHYHAFFAVGNSAYGSETQVSYIYKSTDGITWTKVYQSKSFIYLTDICENDNGVLVAVGQYYIVRSTNGTSWDLRNSNYRFQGVYFAKGVFIGLLTDGIAISRTDGVSWQKVRNIQEQFFYACYSPKLNKIVAVGRYIYESFDGENFILAKTPEQYPLRFISWNDEEEMFYACGLKGYAIRSSDGYEWEEIDLPIEKTYSTYLTGIFFSEESRTFIYGGIFNPRSTIYLAQKIDAVGKEYSVSEQFTNLYEVCKTIATQSEIGWRVKFDDGSLTLECFEGTDRSDTVQFSTDFNSLRDGEFSDSSESYSNAIYIGGKGQNDERDIYEGEDGTPNGLERFEAWDDQSQMTTTDEYTAEALSMLTQYGQTVNVSGNGLAKCPYVYKEQYDVGDIITIAFSGKTAKVQILSVTERWAWNQYDINFSFGKPQNNLADQLQLMLRKIQSASDKTNTTESVKWYTIPTVTSMPAEDVTFNTIGFTGTLTANSTFTLYRDSEGTGAKSYNVYCKNLSGNYTLTLTTEVSGATNFAIKGGRNIVARILVDENGNIVSQSMTATDLIESGNNQPATSSGVAGAINSLDAASVGGAGKYIESISEANGIITAVEKSFGSIAKSNAVPVTGGAVWAYSQILASHNIPRYVNGVLGKDITSYVTDGTLWKRLNGTNGFMLFEDVYAGDYFKMSRAITCPDSYQGAVGSDWVTIGGIDTLMGNGDQNAVNYHHLVMIPGKGEEGLQHFGRHAMNDTNTTNGGYAGSKMHTEVLGAVVSAGSTASGATINQQLYAEFGPHFKTTRDLLSNTINTSGINRFGSAGGCSSNWTWASCQAVLMSEVEVFGSIVWSSSGYDTGNAKTRLPLFVASTKALNNRNAYYWLKDVATAAYFCRVNGLGYPDGRDAGVTGGYVRPRFVLAA